MKKQQAGVGLIEVLIAILIFSFGILGLVGLEARAVSFSTNAEDTNRAALLASEAAAQMWNTGSVTLPATWVTAWQARVKDPTKAGLPNNPVATITVNGNIAEIQIVWRPATAASGVTNRYVTQVAPAF